MKLAFLAFAILSSFSSYAGDCTVAVPKNEFVYEGYSIYFDFSKLLSSHGYQVVDEKAAPRFVLEIQGQMTYGRWFRSAETGYILRETGIEKPRAQVFKTRTCYFTDLCAVVDFQKSFTRAYQELDKTLARCE